MEPSGVSVEVTKSCTNKDHCQRHRSCGQEAAPGGISAIPHVGALRFPAEHASALLQGLKINQQFEKDECTHQFSLYLNKPGAYAFTEFGPKLFVGPWNCVLRTGTTCIPSSPLPSTCIPSPGHPPRSMRASLAQCARRCSHEVRRKAGQEACSACLERRRAACVGATSARGGWRVD